MKRSNIGGIAMVGAVMAFVGIRALLSDSLVISRSRWFPSSPGTSIGGSDLKMFGIFWLVLSLLTLGAALGLWLKSRE